VKFHDVLHVRRNGQLADGADGWARFHSGKF
jgi:hypothetical protein